MWPILFRIGNFEIGSYGILLVAAVLAALALAGHLSKRDHLDAGRVVDVGVGTTFAGIFGSKFLGATVALASGAALSWDEFRNAGAVHGGLIGGLGGAYLLCTHFRLPVRLTLDAYVPAAALGQGLGRLSCFAAGCCFGAPSNAPWSVIYHDAAAAQLGGAPLGVPVHPVQLYDALLHVTFALVLVVLHKQRAFVGRLIGPWCLGEGVLRFGLEAFRGDGGRGIWLGVPSLSTGRITSLAFIGFGLITLFLSRRSAALGQSNPGRF